MAPGWKTESGPLQWEAILHPIQPGTIQIMMDSLKVQDLSGNYNKDTAYSLLWQDLVMKTLSFRGQDSSKLDTVNRTIETWLSDTANPTTLMHFIVSKSANLRMNNLKLFSDKSIFNPTVYSGIMWLYAYDASDSISYNYVIHRPSCKNTNVWYGTNNTSWNDASNWCASVVPDSTDNVFIPHWANNQPMINSPAFCKDILIDSYAIVNMNTSIGLYGKTVIHGKLVNNHYPMIFTSSSPQLIPSGTWDNLRMIRSDKFLTGKTNINDSLFIARNSRINTGVDSIFMKKGSWITENADTMQSSVNGYVATIISANKADSASLCNIGISMAKRTGTRDSLLIARITGDSALKNLDYKVPNGYIATPAGINYVIRNVAGLKSDTAYMSMMPIGRKNISASFRVFSSPLVNPSKTDSLSLLRSGKVSFAGQDLFVCGVPPSGKAVFFSIADVSTISAMENQQGPHTFISAWEDKSANKIIVRINTMNEGRIAIHLCDMSAKVIMNSEYTLGKGEQQFELPLGTDISQGNYILSISGSCNFSKMIMINK